MERQVHRLFFALRPDADALRAIEQQAQTLSGASLMRGKWLSPVKYHLTVRFLGDFREADDIVVRAADAAADMRSGTFQCAFDRIASFPSRFKPPCVLRCTPDSEAALQALAAELGRALARAGLGEYLETRPYLPHLTIAYGDLALPAALPIATICWNVDSFVLIDSNAGEHRQIGCWTLRA